MKCLRLVLTLIILIFPALGAEAIKIGLYTQDSDVIYVGASKSGIMSDGETGEHLLAIAAMKPYRIRAVDNNIQINYDNKDYVINNKKLIIRSTKADGLVYTKRKWYRGALQIVNNGNSLTIINDIDLENYLKGVVPSEMPSSWNYESHKAQAIAARSYAVSNMGKRGKYGYDLKDSDEDQVYKGASAETKRTNKAVESTRGQVLVYDNKVIRAYYHASAGGETLSAKDVWGMNLPYTVPVRSFDDGKPAKGHRVGMSQTGANVLANKGYNAYQILGYFYKNVMLMRLY